MRVASSRGQQGQTATEYVLVVAVVTLALVAGAYTFVPSVQDGVHALADDVSWMLETHELNAAPGAAGKPGPSSPLVTPDGVQAPRRAFPSLQDLMNSMADDKSKRPPRSIRHRMYCNYRQPC